MKRTLRRVLLGGSILCCGLAMAHPYKRSSQHNVRLTEIALPLAGSINLSDEESGISAGDPRLPGLVLDLQSWTRARQIYVIDASGRVRNSGLQPAGAFIDAGGVVAVANPRGSSVSGQDWYRAGFQATKPNSWKDFIACAEWLIAQRYTAPDKLSILGGSAGGILVGMAMAERPDLFASVVSSVGVLDMLRAELTPNGVPNIPEFGSLLWQAGSEGYQLK